ncbi:oxidoreductase NAD-binding domain-containing protein 1 [Octopus sinensis]|uniref:Oxidoreductase NAD-binding domain-containing protein 1 n=1 Tax=Octopus sinensis TaxID=2607531 RepID=A0A6P7T6S6_9MOLL|nr:oxidoreductase NAD-binding domain-containing protein 1 [Octopus sinensis]XP_036365319.1 oxidoreductase NAD-binding domain-containing protein 1 [Octopus sinensis]XP_036365320.1 oxidoreductase NAD-binding domain-containing protein 1 [Octopus sinensis]
MESQESDYRSATVVEIWDLSPTVKGLKLHAEWHKRKSFKAGQWVHTNIPSINRLGGYTLCNSPLEFSKTGILQLAVKYSDHAPTLWFHEKCKIGDTILVEFGGTVFYDPKPQDSQYDLLLIGAGIGMNSLYSILNLVTEREASGVDKELLPGKVHFMYSSKTKKELLYKDKLDEMERNHQNISCQYFVTQEKLNEPNIKDCRINKEDVENAFQMVDKSKCKVFLCLPFEMCNEIEDTLLNQDIVIDQIFSINWW